MQEQATESAPATGSPRSYCWMPTLKLEPGMVIARPVYGGSSLQPTIHLAVGGVITASTIEQLINKGVECVAVERDSAHDEAAYATLVAGYQARLQQIFGAVPDENCRPLLEALLQDLPANAHPR